MTRCRLAYIAEEKGKLFSLDSAQYAIFNGYRETLLERVAGLDTLDRQLQSGTSVDQAEYDTLVQQRIQSQTSLGQYVAYLDSLRQLRISYLLQLNAAVSTSLAPAANHKTVNTILLDWLATDDIASSDMETLISIAGQCPLEGGDAVYEARSLVSHLSGMEFDDRDLCGTQNRQVKRNTRITNSKVVLFPNPTTGDINLEGTPEVVHVRVFNTLGELKIETRIAGKRLSIGTLPAGMYTVHLYSMEGLLLANTKVILIKP